MKNKSQIKNVKIRISSYDLQLLKKQAAKLGVDLNAYVTGILHQSAQE